MSISKKYTDSLEKLQKLVKKLQDDTVLESLENKHDMEALAFLGQLDIILRGFSGRLVKATRKPQQIMFKNDQFVCLCSTSNIFPDCVFDNDKIPCDKKTSEGNDILSKETCPHWVKFEELNKQNKSPIDN